MTTDQKPASPVGALLRAALWLLAGVFVIGVIFGFWSAIAEQGGFAAQGARKKTLTVIGSGAAAAFVAFSLRRAWREAGVATQTRYDRRALKWASALIAAGTIFGIAAAFIVDGKGGGELAWIAASATVLTMVGGGWWMHRISDEFDLRALHRANSAAWYVGVALAMALWLLHRAKALPTPVEPYFLTTFVVAILVNGAVWLWEKRT